MDRILCVVRELTDGSRRGVGRTTHKMNWTKPLGRGGRPLEDLKNAVGGLDGAGDTLAPVTEPLAGEEGRCPPWLPHPQTLPTLASLGGPSACGHTRRVPAWGTSVSQEQPVRVLSDFMEGDQPPAPTEAVLGDTASQCSRGGLDGTVDNARYRCL